MADASVLGTVFGLGILFQANLTALGLLIADHVKTLLKNKNRRLVLVLFSISVFIWAQVVFASLLLPPIAFELCGVFIKISTIFDETMRILLGGFLLHNVAHTTKLPAEKYGLYGLVVARIAAAVAFVASVRPQFVGACLPLSTLLPASVLVLSLDAIIIGTSVIRVFTAGVWSQMRDKRESRQSQRVQSRGLVMLVLGGFIWLGLSAASILAFKSSSILLLVGLPSGGLTVVVNFLVTHHATLAKPRTKDASTPEAHSPFRGHHNDTTGKSMGPDLDSGSYAIRGQNFSNQLFVVNPPFPPPTSNSAVTSIANDTGKQMMGASRQADRVLDREYASNESGSHGISSGYLAANSYDEAQRSNSLSPRLVRNTGPAAKKKTFAIGAVRKMGISAPKLQSSTSDAVTGRIHVVDLVQVAKNDQSARTAKELLTSTNPIWQSSDSKEFDKRIDEKVALATDFSFSRPRNIPFTGMKSAPLMQPRFLSPVAPPITGPTVMLMKDVIYDDPEHVKTIIQDAKMYAEAREREIVENELKYQTSVSSGSSIMHRPRPVKKPSRAESRSFFPVDGADDHGHNRSKSGASNESQRLDMLVEQNPTTPFLPPPTPAKDLQRILPNKTKSMTVDEKMQYLFPAPPQNITSTPSKSRRRSSLPALPPLPAQYLQSAGGGVIKDDSAIGETKSSVQDATQKNDNFEMGKPQHLRRPNMPAVQQKSSIRAARKSQASQFSPKSASPGGTSIWASLHSPVNPLDIAKHQKMATATYIRLQGQPPPNDVTRLAQPAAAVNPAAESSNASSDPGRLLKLYTSGISNDHVVFKSDNPNQKQDVVRKSKAVEHTITKTSALLDEHRETSRLSIASDGNEDPFFLDQHLIVSTPAPPKASTWHKRIGDYLPSFTEGRRQARHGYKIMPPPAPLLLGSRGRKRADAELPRTDDFDIGSSNKALQQIQDQLLRFEVGDRDSFPTMVRKATIKQPTGRDSRLGLLEDLENEMGVQQGRWDLMQHNLARNSNLTISPASESEATPMLPGVNIRASTDSIQQSAGLLFDCHGNFLRLGNRPTIEKSFATAWEQRLANAQREFVLKSPETGRRPSIDFLSPDVIRNRKDSITSQTRTDSSSLLAEMLSTSRDKNSGAVESSVNFQVKFAATKNTAKHTLWQAPSADSVMPTTQLWSKRPAVPRTDSPEPAALTVRPARRRIASELRIFSIRLWVRPVRVTARVPRGLWNSSKTRPKSVLTRPMMNRRKSKRQTVLADIVESPQPLPDKRGTLGIFQFPWGEKSDQPTTFQPSRLSFVSNMALYGGAARSSAHEARSRELEHGEEYNVSFFDDYEQDDSDDSDEDSDSEFGSGKAEEQSGNGDNSDDEFVETTLWKIAELMQANKTDIPSRESMFERPGQSVIFDSENSPVLEKRSVQKFMPIQPLAPTTYVAPSDSSPQALEAQDDMMSGWPANVPVMIGYASSEMTPETTLSETRTSVLELKDVLMELPDKHLSADLPGGLSMYAMSPETPVFSENIGENEEMAIALGMKPLDPAQPPSQFELQQTGGFAAQWDDMPITIESATLSSERSHVLVLDTGSQLSQGALRPVETIPHSRLDDSRSLALLVKQVGDPTPSETENLPQSLPYQSKLGDRQSIFESLSGNKTTGTLLQAKRFTRTPSIKKPDVKPKLQRIKASKGDWKAALVQAIAAGHVERKKESITYRYHATSEEWAKALHEAIGLGEAMLSRRAYASRGSVATIPAAAEENHDSSPIQIELPMMLVAANTPLCSPVPAMLEPVSAAAEHDINSTSATRHPVFFGQSMQTTAESVHPAAIGYCIVSSPKISDFDGVRAPVHQLSLRDLEASLSPLPPPGTVTPLLSSVNEATRAISMHSNDTQADLSRSEQATELEIPPNEQPSAMASPVAPVHWLHATTTDRSSDSSDTAPLSQVFKMGMWTKSAVQADLFANLPQEPAPPRPQIALPRLEELSSDTLFALPKPAQKPRDWLHTTAIPVTDEAEYAAPQERSVETSRSLVAAPKSPTTLISTPTIAPFEFGASQGSPGTDCNIPLRFDAETILSPELSTPQASVGTGVERSWASNQVADDVAEMYSETTQMEVMAENIAILDANTYSAFSTTSPRSQSSLSETEDLATPIDGSSGQNSPTHTRVTSTDSIDAIAVDHLGEELMGAEMWRYSKTHGREVVRNVEEEWRIGGRSGPEMVRLEM